MNTPINHILPKNKLDALSQSLFVSFRAKDQIFENLEIQEDMKKWILHHIADAKGRGVSFVDVKVWSESGGSDLGSSNQSVISWLEQEGYCACVNEQKSITSPIPFTRNVFLTITIPSDK